MKIHSLQLIGTLCFTALLCLPAHADDANNPRYSAKVKVTVSANENIKSLVSSYLNKELRSINDVELVYENPEWEIAVLTSEVKDVNGYKIGFVISTVIIRSFDNQILSGYFRQKFKGLGMEFTSGLCDYPVHWLHVGSTGSLQDLCEEIIADFDTTYLDKSREMFQKADQTVKEVFPKLVPPLKARHE